MKATALAGANIAFLKYWGNRDPELNLPMNSSLSLTLGELLTQTAVEFSPALVQDEVQINDIEPDPASYQRIVAHLDRLRGRKGINFRARVRSRNNFPAGAGLASSASGFAALTVAAAQALTLAADERELSRLARLGSGSAARSIFGGYVEWVAGESHESSYAQQIAPPGHWEIIDLIAIVSTEQKEASSRDGHRLAPTSPLYPARLASVPQALAQMKDAILSRNFSLLGPLVEAEALSLHAIMMTSQPSLIYWTPETVTVIKAVQAWRKEGLAAYFTLDAGPNVHVLTLPQYAEEVRSRLLHLSGVREVIHARPGPEAKIVSEHLF